MLSWHDQCNTLIISLCTLLFREPHEYLHDVINKCMVLTFSLMQDPRASTSQSFTNMMTLHNDAAVELLMASDPTPSSGGKGVSRRGSGYIQCEDIQLCTSWMNISNDPIIGNEQPSKTYWNRIADDFHQNRDFDSNRSANSLEH